MVECQLPKLDVVGSNPIARFRFCGWFMGQLYHLTIERFGRRSESLSFLTKGLRRHPAQMCLISGDEGYKIAFIWGEFEMQKGV